MTFKELYSSKSKYSQRIIDIEIGKKRIDPLLSEFSSRYYNWIFRKSYEDFNSIEEYRNYLMSRPRMDAMNVYQRFAESSKRRFTQDEWDIIKEEHERQKAYKRIRREEMYKNEYDLQDISKETKEYLQRIEVFIMKKIGLSMTAIGNEMNKSFSWVAKRYGERPYLDDCLKAHINNLKLISRQIADTLAVETDNHYFYEALYGEFNQKKVGCFVTCKFESCGRGCISIIKELEQKFDWDFQNVILERQQEFCNVFRECLCTLESREAEILDRYFGCSGERETYSGIVKSQGVSRETIRQVKCKAIRKMRHPSRYKRIMKEYS